VHETYPLLVATFTDCPKRSCDQDRLTKKRKGKGNDRERKRKEKKRKEGFAEGIINIIIKMQGPKKRKKASSRSIS
jgi:hypothetical protein